MTSQPGTKGIQKPFYLTLLALLLLLFPDSALFFAGAVAIAAGIGLMDLWRLVTRPDKIRFAFTFAVSILLGYGLGSLIYLANYRTFDATQHQYWAPNGLLFDRQGLSTALAACVLAAAVLYLRAAFERPLYSPTTLVSVPGPKPERLAWLGVAVAMLALYLGHIGYMGTFAGEKGHVSPLGAIANLMVPPLVPFTLLLITDGTRPAARKLLLSAVLAFLIGVTFVLGRRYLLYALVLSAVALTMRGYRLRTKGGLAVLIAGGVAGVLLIYLGFSFFMALRLAVEEHGPDAGLAELVGAAISQISGAQATVVQERLAENVGSRLFILSYLAGLMGINSYRMPAFGAELLYSVQMAIPSAFMPGKLAALPSAHEELVHPRYGIPIFDGPGSVLVAGFDDFGFIGAMVYPLGVVLLYGWFNKGLRAIARDGPIRLFVLFTLLFQLLYIEEALASVFVMLRNLLIVVGVAWVIGRLPVLQLTWRFRPRRPVTRFPVTASSAEGRPHDRFPGDHR